MPNYDHSTREVPTWQKIKIIWNQPRIAVPLFGDVSPKLMCVFFLLSYAGLMTCSVAAIANAASMSWPLFFGNMVSFAACVASAWKLRGNPFVRKAILAKERDLNRASTTFFHNPARTRSVEAVSVVTATPLLPAISTPSAPQRAALASRVTAREIR